MYSVAIGIGSKNAKGEWLEVYYPSPLINPADAFVQALAKISGYAGGNTAISLTDEQLSQIAESAPDAGQADIAGQLKGSDGNAVLTLLESDDLIESTPEAYLKLHLLSHRLVLPNEQNLDGIFAQLPNVAWTDFGPVDVNELTSRQIEARKQGQTLEVTGIDKFPRMTNYVAPSGVRIAHGARVRLGAYLGEGTTVMHEGFVNFNAGCEGPNMIEGRVSQGVFVESGTDLGGSASTMGTLSGGGDVKVRIGKDCLIGANAGVGISLGDRCKVEAGLYVTASTIVQILDENKNFVKLARGREISGQSDMLLIRNSQTGVVECRTNSKAIQLNDALHAHN